LEIKIVGAIPDADTLNELQHIAKVFAYEQHMKHFDYPKQDTKLLQIKPLKLYKKVHDNNTIETYLSQIRVKGFC